MKIALRIAAVLILIHLLGHGLGHSTWDKPEDPKMQEVVNTMKGYEAVFMGASKSMADYYMGYSYIMFGLYFMSILMLWLLSGSVESIHQNRRIFYVTGLTYLYFGVVEYLHFFPFAAGISFLAGLLTVLSPLFFRYTGAKYNHQSAIRPTGASL